MTHYFTAQSYAPPPRAGAALQKMGMLYLGGEDEEALG